MPPVLATRPPRRDEPHFLAWAAAALARGEDMPAGLAGWLPPEGEVSLAAG